MLVWLKPILIFIPKSNLHSMSLLSVSYRLLVVKCGIRTSPYETAVSFNFFLYSVVFHWLVPQVKTVKKNVVRKSAA